MGYPVTVDNVDQFEQAYKNAHKYDNDDEQQRIKDNHAAWSKVFLEAENNRRTDERKWRELYYQIYSKEKEWWQEIAFYVLNGIQLWALYTQYKQQKEIADQTWDIANRQLTLAENMYAQYKEQYQPHEIKLGEDINAYFDNPYRPQYEITAGRFALNARVQMVGKRREALMCASQYCTGAIATTLQDLALEEAKLVGNAMNSAVKYEKLREWNMTKKWVNTRLMYIQTGRGVSQQAVVGIDGAVNAFTSFGADPGAALGQLLGTIAFTMGSQTPGVQYNPGNSQVRGTSPYAINNVQIQRPTVKAKRNG